MLREEARGPVFEVVEVEGEKLVFEGLVVAQRAVEEAVEGGQEGGGLLVEFPAALVFEDRFEGFVVIVAQ